MAGVIRNSLLSAAKKIVSPCSSQILRPTSRISCEKWPSIGIFPLNVSRSLWYMSSRKEFSPLSTRVVSPATNQCSCGCHSKQLHTEVDEMFSQFLDKEIKLEESTKTNQNLPTLKGFELSKSDGSEVELVRKNGNETITVKVNVNGSIDSDNPQIVEGQGEEESSDMVAKPNFTVELNKGDNQTLSILCYFPVDDVVDEAQEDAEEDSFEIQEVSIYNGEWTESIYTAHAETMDGNLYDLFMDMLDDRGIDDEFVNGLVKFSTIYEHGKYVGFLKDLKTFVTKN